ncbi:hypothetical protein [Actinoallomurus sp. NPDC052274]|uniref:hypothetical protein n=1 Tax=Actinoallomurus sp. NPDC052274 TaxID=3155420 RepID=UPI0034418796
MTQSDVPMFGERVRSWESVWSLEFPEEMDALYRNDSDTKGMQRLRGLVIAQCVETETILGKIVKRLDQTINIEGRTTGGLLEDARTLLGDEAKKWEKDLLLIGEAIECRNHTVHSCVTMGCSWADYATGDGGEWVPVSAMMGDEDYSESDLLCDLDLQQRATVRAVHLLHSLGYTLE